MFQEPRNQEPGPCDDYCDEPSRFRQRQEQLLHRVLGLAGQEWSHQHHRHHCQVLENQDADRGATMNRITLTAVRQHLEHNRCTA